MVPDFRGLENLAESEKLNEIKRRFIAAARAIIFDHDLVFHQFCEPRKMQITSLELYLHCAAWPDPNTDMHPEQLNRCTWYIPSDRDISRIDISSGSRCESIYAGLLIREIAGCKGPMFALRHIVRGSFQAEPQYDWRWRSEEIETVEQINKRSIFSGPLRLIPREESHRGELWIGPRIGLKGADEFNDVPLQISVKNVRGKMRPLPSEL